VDLPGTKITIVCSGVPDFENNPVLKEALDFFTKIYNDKMISSINIDLYH
jgi:hypothetical protein